MIGGSWIILNVSSSRVAAGFLSLSAVTDGYLVGIAGRFSSSLYIFSCGVARGFVSSSAVTDWFFVGIAAGSCNLSSELLNTLSAYSSTSSHSSTSKVLPKDTGVSSFSLSLLPRFTTIVLGIRPPM
jgi:hypothetical protein